MLGLNHALLVGPLLLLVPALTVIGSSIPPLGIVIAAEPILVAATLTAGHGLPIQELLAMTVAAAVIGDVASYWLGRTFGPRLLNTRIGRRSRKHIYRAHHKLQHRGALGAMVVQRWAPPARGFVLAMLGTARQPFGRFVGYSLFASALWALVFVLGVHFGGLPLVLIIPTVATTALVLQVIRRLGARPRDRRDNRGPSTPELA